MDVINFLNNLHKSDFQKYSILLDYYFRNLWIEHDLIDIGIDPISGMAFIVIDNNILIYLDHHNEMFFRHVWNNEPEFDTYQDCLNHKNNIQ